MNIKLPIRYLKAAALFASKDATRYILNGVRVEVTPKSVIIAATDGRRLFCVNPTNVATINEGDTEAITVPLSLLAAVPAGAGDVTIVTSGDKVKIETKNGLAYADSIVSGNYPNWRSVIPKPSNKGGRLNLSLRLLAPFFQADKMLSGGGAVALEADSDTSAILIRGLEVAEADWLGVQMPMRQYLENTLPGWL